MFLFLSCSCLCPIHWSQVLRWKWRCSWSSADRRCSNYICVINTFITFQCASYIRDAAFYGVVFGIWYIAGVGVRICKICSYKIWPKKQRICISWLYFFVIKINNNGCDLKRYSVQSPKGVESKLMKSNLERKLNGKLNGNGTLHTFNIGENEAPLRADIQPELAVRWKCLIKNCWRPIGILIVVAFS